VGRGRLGGRGLEQSMNLNVLYVKPEFHKTEPLSPVLIHGFTLKFIHGRGDGVRAQWISRELFEKWVEVSSSERGFVT